MKDLDRASGLFFFFFSVYLIYATLQLPIGGFHHPEAGFLPLGLALAMLILSTFQLIGAFKKGHVKEWFTLGEGKFRVAVAMASMLLYVLVLNRLGYLVSTFLITVFLLKGIERQKWLTTLLITIPSVVVTYLVFSRWLGVPLPKGVIPL
jgi:putative tricarboxylic transport membrane protein